MPDAASPLLDPATAGLSSPVDARTMVALRRQETDSRVAELNSLLTALEQAAAAMPHTAPPSAAAAAAAPPLWPSPSPAAASAAPLFSGSPPVAASATPADPPAAVAPPRPIDDHENRLAQVRLGLASSLFTALQYKHPPTASHSLRVALGCSTWALYKRLDDDARDVLEVAALLHDVGKIALPDELLERENRLTPEEQRLFDAHWESGVHIIACCCPASRVLEAVRHAGRRFDDQRGSTPAAESLPLESRMIAIVDAYDRLTGDAADTEPRSRDEALRELLAGAGARFDPMLVRQFIELASYDQSALTRQVAIRWLNELGKRQTQLPWQGEGAIDASPSCEPAFDLCALFEQHLIDSMQDGVIFVDEHRNIFMWSKGAERMTGVSAAAATGRPFTPGLLDMCNAAGRRVRDEACPVARALASEAQLRQRLEILGRSGEHVAIDLHAMPVYCKNGQLRGATVLLQDAQPEVSLEEKCEALHAEVTKDPMTKVANRAEFDRMLALFIEAHQQADLPCSLIMTDIDHFKSINDTFGHQAGDEAIITVATLLKSMCRSGDLVARYGGEEFAVLCADCTIADAAARADEIRRRLAETQHAYLAGRKLTSSFGVAQLQAGDTSETLLRRSDQALLMAKEQGRNRVVQLGGVMSQSPPQKRKWWSFGVFRSEPVVQTTLATEVPMNIAIEKLRGFVTDQRAKVISIREPRVELEMTSENMGAHRRRGDRASTFRIEIEFSERRHERTNTFGLAAGSYVETMADVTIRPKRRRDRRRSDQAERARLILQSLKGYLMAKEPDHAPPALAASR